MSDKDPAHNLLTAIRWANIRRIADELDIAAAEVGSAYWVTLARQLRDRAVFEEECLKGFAVE